MEAATPAARAVAVLLAGLALTALVVAVLAGTAQERDRQRFQAETRAVQDAIVDRVNTSIALLRSAAGLFASHENQLTVSSFAAYMDRVALRAHYPGILGLGFSRRIRAEERAALERQMREQGHENFQVWPLDERPELNSIVFLEPLDRRNRAAIGYDMTTNPVRREAMARARDSGSAAASGVVELVQEIQGPKQPGFLIYLPVYRGGAIPNTPAARRERLIGFAYSPIRAHDFLSSAFFN
jgi:CHASE1-domain containing sensor protein